MMYINTYKDCSKIADVLKSKILGGIEANKLQKYSIENFGKETDIYNQISDNEDGYSRPYISINVIGKQESEKITLGVDIDFAIPEENIETEKVNGVFEYNNRYKLDEFADIIVELVEKACVNNQDYEIVFRPDQVDTQSNEYSGNIQVTYISPVILSKRRY